MDSGLKSILRDLDERTDGKQSVSVYVSRALWERFKDKIAPHTPSAVIEKLLERLLDGRLCERNSDES
jgi:hypothetical protein